MEYILSFNTYSGLNWDPRLLYSKLAIILGTNTTILQNTVTVLSTTVRLHIGNEVMWDHMVHTVKIPGLFIN
jgi:hypothetical protein